MSVDTILAFVTAALPWVVIGACAARYFANGGSMGAEGTEKVMRLAAVFFFAAAVFMIGDDCIVNGIADFAAGGCLLCAARRTKGNSAGREA